MMRKLCASTALVAALVGGAASTASAQGGQYYNDSTLTGSFLTFDARVLNHGKLPQGWRGVCVRLTIQHEGAYGAECTFKGYALWVNYAALRGECVDLANPNKKTCDVWGNNTLQGGTYVASAFQVTLSHNGNAWSDKFLASIPPQAGPDPLPGGGTPQRL